MVSFGLFVLYHINPCGLFDTKADLVEEKQLYSLPLSPSSSSSSIYAVCTDFPDSLVPIIHASRQVFLTIPCVRTELL